jgi:NAD(P)-dependent dehydrogenase (short-subunit alcohol dehydrogenase family)
MKAIVITGAGARVGKHIAKGLASDGWFVAVHYNNSNKGANRLVDEIKESGGRAAAIGANLNIPQELGSLMESAAKAAEAPITALINNASTFSPDRADTFDSAMFDHHINVNLKAPLMLAQQFALQLPKAKRGNIINILDQRVLKPNPLYFTYSLSKAALNWATKTLAQSLAPHIRVNAIGPGPTLRNTQQTADEFDAETNATLLKRGTDLDAILDAARYILSADTVTGQMITVDGGQHLTWQTEDLLIGLDHGA